jgi:hypothetical protein
LFENGVDHIYDQQAAAKGSLFVICMYYGRPSLIMLDFTENKISHSFKLGIYSYLIECAWSWKELVSRVPTIIENVHKHNQYKYYGI